MYWYILLDVIRQNIVQSLYTSKGNIENFSSDEDIPILARQTTTEKKCKFFLRKILCKIHTNIENYWYNHLGYSCKYKVGGGDSWDFINDILYWINNIKRLNYISNYEQNNDNEENNSDDIYHNVNNLFLSKTYNKSNFNKNIKISKYSVIHLIYKTGDSLFHIVVILLINDKWYFFDNEVSVVQFLGHKSSIKTFNDFIIINPYNSYGLNYILDNLKYIQLIEN
jgi:hypothetical protein